MNMHTKFYVSCFCLLLAGLTPLRGSEPVPSFSGNDSYINLGTPAELQIANNQPFTVEGWIYLRTADSRNMLFCKNNRSSSYSYMLGFIDNTKMAAYPGSGSWVEPTPSVTIAIDAWHHAAYSYDGTNMAFYIDGEPKGTAAFTFANTPSHQISIGGYTATSDIDGMYSDVRVWNHARSAAQVADYMSLRLTGAEPGLLGYWPLNEGAGTEVYDLTPGVSSTGTLVNATWIDASAPPLGSDDALYISGAPANYATVSPPYGLTNGLVTGNSFLCSAPTGTLAVAAGTRAYCAGYELYTNMFTPVLTMSDTTNAFTYTHDGYANLVWQWEPIFLVDIVAGTGGTVSTNGGWYDEGSSVSVTALPDEGYEFFRWTGELPEIDRYREALTFASTQPVSLTATFRPTGTNTYYVGTHGDDWNSGLSWDTAFAHPKTAVDFARDGDTVLVSNGTYSVVGQIAVTNGITLRSVNGADETIIESIGGTERLLLIKHTDAIVDGFSITKGSYGGVYIDQAGTLLNSIVSDNDSTLNTLTYGGGVYLNQGGLVKNCQIINNTLNRSGGYNHYAGGVYMTGGGMLDACIISNNVSRYGTGTGGQGGGVYMTGSATRMRNCLITRNSHNMNTSGVYCNLGVIENCTIVDNYCDPITAAAGLYSSNGKVINTIIAYNNNASGLSNYRNAGTTWTYQNSCTDPLVAGDGNTDRAPQFIDLEARDYRLLAGPCVNTGINQAWMESSLDLDGNPRIVSETVDMGAYEHIPGSLRIGYEGIPTEGFSSNLVVFTAYASGTNTTGLYYRWSFKNDETIDNEGFGHSVVTNLYGPGIHSVSLTVSNAIDEADTLVREQYIKVAPEIAYVSTNGTSVIPYDTWATAATNIHDAVAVSSDGTLILVSNGVYQISRQIELTQNIAVRSINGAEHTTIRRQSGTASIFYTTQSEAVIDGFTLANSNQSAVYLDGAGVVSNCIIRDTYTVNNTAFGGGVRLEGGGHVSNCHIINNYVQSSGGAGRHGGGIYLNGGGLVEFCVISNNAVGVGTGSSYRGGGVYMSGGTLRNSLIYGNRHNVAAGGVYCTGGVVENCTIVSNACTKATDAVAGLQSVNGTIRNTIVQFNTAASGVYNYLNSGSTTYDNCNTDSIAGLVGDVNIDGDPLFKNVAHGDYRLKTDSPCLNAGAYQDWMEGAFDLAGEPRIKNHIVDIGAYEGHLPDGTSIIVR